MIRWSGPVLIVWAVHLLVKDSIFAFTHGSSESAAFSSFLGLDSSQYSVLWTPFPLLAAAGLGGVRSLLSTLLGRSGNLGLLVAIIAAATWFIAGVMQLDSNFYSPLVLGGFILSILSFLVLALGLIVAGLDIRRRNALPQAGSVVLVIGLLGLPTLFARAWVVGHSDDTLPWRILYIAMIVPWTLAWARLGSAMTIARAKVRPEFS